VSAILEVEGLKKYFPVGSGLLRKKRQVVRALDGVDLTVDRGECLGIVGESGSGKTTLGRCLIRLIEPTAGTVRFRGEEILELSSKRLRQRRRHFQMIFQDPYGSLNPRMNVDRTISEPLRIHGMVNKDERRARVLSLLDLVGLPQSALRRYPHEFSGGQRQRIGIARALATEPDLIVADEPVSALDVSVQAQIINLLASLQNSLDLALIFIAHDLAVVEHIAHRVAVMYLGKVVELTSSSRLFGSPLHPYTVALLSAVPVADPGRRRGRILLAGDPPSPLNPPAGCSFHTRCPIAKPQCQTEEPQLVELDKGHFVACHFPGELSIESGSRGTS